MKDDQRPLIFHEAAPSHHRASIEPMWEGHLKFESVWQPSVEIHIQSSPRSYGDAIKWLRLVKASVEPGRVKEAEVREIRD